MSQSAHIAAESIETFSFLPEPTYKEVENPILLRPRMTLAQIQAVVFQIERQHGVATTKQFMEATGYEYVQALTYLKHGVQHDIIERVGERGGWRVVRQASLQSTP